MSVDSKNKNIARRFVRSSLRARLLCGASSLALPAASIIVALGVCIPDDAQAQTTVNPVQNTTFTLDPAQNPTIFDTGTNIDTTATVGAKGVSGDANTQWTVVNRGTIAADYRGISLDGAGSNITNHGTISQTDNLVGSAGIFLGNGGLVINEANATISTFSEGILVDGGLGNVVNSGTITSTDGTAVFLKRNGAVTNDAGGAISGKFFGILVTGSGAGTVANAGSITATDSVDGVGVSGLISSLTNLTGGTISGGKTGVDNGVTGSTITNEQNATISGGMIGIDRAAGTVMNAGTITGGTTGIQSFNTLDITNALGATISGGTNGILLGSAVTVTNAGTIEATGVNGFAIKGIPDVTVTDNSGTIQATKAGGIGIFAGGTATVTKNTGTITGAATGISSHNVNVTGNAGAISGNTGIFASGIATVSNLLGGTITGNATGIQAGTLDLTNAAGATISGGQDGIRAGGTVTNAGTITGGSRSVELTGDSTLINQAGGTISGALGVVVLAGVGTITNAGTINGGLVLNSGGSITNSLGGAISSDFDGIIVGGAASITNAGKISAGAGFKSVSFLGTGPNVLTLQPGSVLNGDVQGSTAVGATNKLILQGSGQADNNFRNFDTLDVKGNSFWFLRGNANVGTATVSSGVLIIGSVASGTSSALLTGNVTVKSGAALAGQGTIMGDVLLASGGAVLPGGAALAAFNTGFGTLTASGNVTFQDGSVFHVKADAAGQNDKLAVGGTATVVRSW